MERAKPPAESLSSYFRKVLRRDLRRAQLMQAAAAYREFLETVPEEQAWIEEWDEADLASAPRRRHKCNAGASAG